MADQILVMCLPLSLYPSPPTDQPDCKVEQCPECKEDMWVSAKKRALREEFPGIRVWCGLCVATQMEGHEIHAFDIAKLQEVKLNE